MKLAYADPPYIGQASLYKDHPDYNGEVDHKELLQRLEADYDGWALSASSPSLRQLLPLCPDDVRIAAWVKPFASFKPEVNPAFTWEPVLFRSARKRERFDFSKRTQHLIKDTVRDHHVENMTLQRGLTGTKPMRFCWWVFNLLGAEPGDTLDDLFPGTGAVSKAWNLYTSQEKQGTLTLLMS
jgi:hypothetical protein